MFTVWASPAPVVYRWVRAPVDRLYVPTFIVGLPSGANTASGSVVTLPPPALYSALGKASPATSLSFRAVSAGLGSPTFTGIWYRSRMRWRDGSFDPCSPVVDRPRRA